MKTARHKLSLAVILGIFAALYRPGNAYAQNTNTTFQEGRVNINYTYQCGMDNVNSTYQSGEININRTFQTCGNGHRRMIRPARGYSKAAHARSFKRSPRGYHKKRRQRTGRANRGHRR